MFNWLYKFLGMMLSFFSSITGSYALALLFYALIFKILFLPFSIKQQKSQIKLAKLAPKEALIRAKYKGRTDQRTMQKMQQEIMELRQKEGSNPLSGCLPLLLQILIMFPLYAVIQSPISYIANENKTIEDYNDSISTSEVVNIDELSQYYSDFVSGDNKKEIEIGDIALTIYKNLPQFENESAEDYSARRAATELPKNYEITLINQIYKYVNTENGAQTKEERIALIEGFGIEYDSIPNFNVFGVNLAETPSFKNISILIIIPFLAAFSSWFSMWLMRKLNNTGMNMMNQPQDAQTKASMRIMDLILPLMTLWIAFGFSAMLGLYWVYQSILGLLQSLILSRAMPLPKYTEEEMKEMRRAQKEVEKAQRAAAKAQPKHKSLHYIDDDDYDELPTVKNNNDQKKPQANSSDIPEIKD